MGCGSSKSAGGGAVVVGTGANDYPSSSARGGRKLSTTGGGDDAIIKPQAALKAADKIGAADATACTASTGGGSSNGSGGEGGEGGGTCCGSTVPTVCCAETHRSELSSHHDGSEHGDDHDHDEHEHDHDHRDEEVVLCKRDGRRPSLSVDEIFQSRAEGGVGRGMNDSVEMLTEIELPEEFLHIDLPHDKPIEEVYSGVRDGPVLGEGVCGTVRQITHRFTGDKFALKRLDLSAVRTDEELRRLREEIYIMCQLDHPNIVRLEEVYENLPREEIFLVQDLLDGGELFDRLDEQPDYRYTEAECARLVMQMLCAVRYIHSKGIVHRDLKLENFLFESRRPDAPLKMIDFGLSKHFNVGDTHCDVVGTPYTVAPEVVRGRYDERCDVWGVGVLAFFLLSGDPPFGGCGGPEPLHEVRENILAGRYRFEPGCIWEDASDDAKDFIRALLVTDPAGRPTAREVQGLPWLNKWETGRMDGEQSGATKTDVVTSIKRVRSGGQLSHLSNLSLINFDEDLEDDAGATTNMLPPLDQ